MAQTERQSAPGVATPGETNANHASASKSKTGAQSSTASTAARPALPLSARQEELLEARGISLELAARMGWRSAKPGAFGSSTTIEIPFYRAGKEVNCKTRTIEGDKKFCQEPGGDKCFYNLDALTALGEEALIITEGEMDCLIALQCGFVAVSVPDGAPASAIGDKETVKYDYLDDMPQGIARIILAVDSDNAGANLFHDLSIRLGVHRCMFVIYPAGCKDLNDTFLQGGAEAVRTVLAGAQFSKMEGLYTMAELPPLPFFPAHNVGIPALSSHFRLRRGDLSVVTGIPSHGKSTFVNAIAHNMAVMCQWKTCFASFEQPPQTEHRKALRTLYGEKPEHFLTAEEKAEADAFIAKQFVFIVPGDLMKESADLTWLLDRMVAAATRHAVKMIVIDPWNDIEHLYDSRATTMTQYIGMAIRELKQFARKYQVHVMIIAHPAKMRKEKETGDYPIPTAYDISDSAHWYNKPEQVLIVHRQRNGNTLLRIAKSRYHYALGKPGDVELRFNESNYQFA